MTRAFTTLVVYSADIVLLFALWDFAVQQWRASLTRRVDAALRGLRERHAEELRAAQQYHDDWCKSLLQMHHDAIAKMQREAQQRTDAAVADVMARYCRERGAA